MKVNVVTAPEHRYFPRRSMKVFLAGGICKCIEWQKMVINEFTKDDGEIQIDNFKYGSLYLLNPRRTDWIEEPGAAERQIEWEFDMIERCDLFAMYFAGGESDQPICMYELGRNIERMKERFPQTWYDRIIITCDSTYKRLTDVIVQTRLATDNLVRVNVVEGDENSVIKHANAIKGSFKYLFCENE